MEKRALRIFFIHVGVWGGDLGVDGGWTPLPIRPQRYCDPASLVHCKKVLEKVLNASM